MLAIPSICAHPDSSEVNKYFKLATACNRPRQEGFYSYAHVPIQLFLNQVDRYSDTAVKNWRLQCASEEEN